MTDVPHLSAVPSIEGLYRDHRERIYRYFVSRVGNTHDAEELTQRVFLDAISALSTGTDPPDSMLGWLYTVAQRRLTDELRRRQQSARLFERLVPNSRHRQEPYDKTTAAALSAAIEGLPLSQRRIVVLRLVNGLSFAEIATHIGSSEAAAKMAFSRAAGNLREALRSFDPAGH